MDQETFVKNIHASLKDQGTKSLLRLLAAPPGRNPRKKLRELSEWYNSSSNDEKEKIRQLIEETIDFTIFGFFCILDQVRFLENEEEKTQFSLSAIKDGHSIILNDPSKEELHNVYNSLTRGDDS